MKFPNKEKIIIKLIWNFRRDDYCIIWLLLNAHARGFTKLLDALLLLFLSKRLMSLKGVKPVKRRNY